MFSLYWIFALAICSVSFAFDDFFDESKHEIKWLKCKPDAKIQQADDLNEEWFKEAAKKGMYYVMGNKWHFISAKRALTGEPPKGRADTNKACLSYRATEDGFVIKGFGDSVASYKCDDTQSMTSRSECLPTSQSTNETWAASRGSTEATIVWTDNKKWALGVRCNQMYQVWSLRSTENADVDDETKATVVSWIKDHEFKEENVVTYPRAHCPNHNS